MAKLRTCTSHKFANNIYYPGKVMDCDNLILLLVAFKKKGLSNRCRFIFFELFIQIFIDDLYYHQYINYITRHHVLYII